MIRYIKKYKGFLRCTMEERLAFKWSFLFSWVTNLVGIMVSVFLWKVLYDKDVTISGYTWDEMIVYLLLVALLNAILGEYTELNLLNEVLDGSVANNLTKPIGFQHMCLFRALGNSIIEAVVSVTGFGFLAFLLVDLEKYWEPKRLLLFILSSFMAYFIKFCLAYLGGVMCFFTSNGYGVVYLRQIITDIFSGALLPLSFFPPWFQTLSYFLPFQAVVHLPIQIFLGHIDEVEIYHALVIQGVWIVIMWMTGRGLFQLGVKKITVHGG